MKLTSALPVFVLAPLMAFTAAAGQEGDARLLVEQQVRTAAAAILVLEEEGISPGQRAVLLQPLAESLEYLNAQRATLDAASLEVEEARAAANGGVQKIALRLLRALEQCAATDYEGSSELRAAVERLALAFEGGEEEENIRPTPATEQSGAAPAH